MHCCNGKELGICVLNHHSTGTFWAKGLCIGDMQEVRELSDVFTKTWIYMGQCDMHLQFLSKPMNHAVGIIKHCVTIRSD